jgi:BolA protein
MPRKERIEHQLSTEFTPLFLTVEDESSQHHVPKDAQTHYKITMASAQFVQVSRVNRHRLVNHLLKEEFNTGMHALSMHLYTPEEWETKSTTTPASPSCRDGYQNK